MIKAKGLNFEVMVKSLPRLPKRHAVPRIVRKFQRSVTVKRKTRLKP